MGLTERLARGLVGLAAVLVPASRRAAWREEWASEIWHHVHGAEGTDPGSRGQVGLLAHCVGAFPHALWILGEEWNMDTVLQDLRFGLRTLAKRPAFTAIAVTTLALGIGANTAVFSVVDAVVLRPLPMPNADRLLWMWGRIYEGRPIASVSPPDFEDYRGATGGVFEVLAAYSSFSNRVGYNGGDQPEELGERSCTSDFLEALGLAPVLGRSFTPEETRAASTDVVMISHGVWERLYGSDPDVIGRTIRLSGEANTIIGVLPARLGIQDDVDVWRPLLFGHDDYQSRASHFLRPLAVLRPGVDRAQAQRALDAVSARLEAAYPETNQDWYPLVEPLQTVVLGSARPALLTLLGAVALVLLIACANVGNLLLARSGERRAEMAVRAALGASRGRITRQLLIESLLLAVLGAAAGLVVAVSGMSALRGLAAANIPRMDEVSLDGRVLGVTLLITAVAGILFGLFPALTTPPGRLSAAMGGVGRSRGTRRGARVRASLVVGEVALSFVLLTCATLLMRSFVSLSAVDPGFDPHDVLTLPVSFPGLSATTGFDVVGLQEQIRERVASVPGVREAAFTNIVPMSGDGRDTYVYAEGRPPSQIRRVENTAELRFSSEDYFTAMGVPLVRGRPFDASDREGSEPVTVVNERLVARLFPGEDPIGKGLVVLLDEPRTFRIVGVVGDMHQHSLGQPAREELHLSTRQRRLYSVTLVVKGRSAMPSVDAVRAAVREVDPSQPLTRVATLDRFVGDALASGRFQTVLLGIFAALAVALAAVGLYGVVAQTVAERRHEIGVRLAMGAERGEVVRMIVRQGLKVAAVGVLVGGAVAFAATGLLKALLYGVGPRDPIAFGLTPVLLLAVALLSSWLPARRAARVDPVQSLRAE